MPPANRNNPVRAKSSQSLYSVHDFRREFPDDGRRGRLRLLASRAGREGSVTIHQDAEVFDASLAAGEELTHELRAGRHAWLQVISGSVSLNVVELKAGDGAAASEEERLVIHAAEPSEIILFDLA